MSEKEIVEMRDEVKRYLDQADETTIRKFYELIEEDNSEGWWDTLPITVKETVEKALKQADRGELILHEDIKRMHPQWFTK